MSDNFAERQGRADAKASYERIILNLPAEKSLAIPLFRGFASPPGTVLVQRLERRYRRLCFVQEELGRLASLKKGSGLPGVPAAASSGKAEKAANNLEGEGGLDNGAVSFEDFVFSHTDFSRYSKIAEEDFDFFPESVDDFENEFFIKNFKLEKAATKNLVLDSYKKSGSLFLLARVNPVILSIMRTLETSLDSLPLLTKEEVLEEFKALYGFMKEKRAAARGSRETGAEFTAENIGPFFNFLLYRLDGLRVFHKDGNETKLFINPEGNLSGIFRPGGKDWTLKLAEADSGIRPGRA